MLINFKFYELKYKKILNEILPNNYMYVSLSLQSFNAIEL